MTAPRIEADLGKITENTRQLVARLAPKGIAVTAVTKAVLGSPAVGEAVLQGGASALGDSRIENIASLHSGNVGSPLRLIRSPMLSQVDRVVRLADSSCNSELAVIEQLSAAAGRQGTRHGVVLMVELGDLREGVLPDDLVDLAQATLALPHLRLAGLGANLACRSGVVPDETNMGELTRLAEEIESKFGVGLDVVSGGNSANLDWALTSADTGRINDLRLGEALLLGREPLHRQPIPGLHTDAFRVVGEVIELQRKPSQPWGSVGQAAFGAAEAVTGAGDVRQALVALGRQDVDPAGLTPPVGTRILGASSDHLVMDVGDEQCRPGCELAFEVDYSALLRAMTSPFVATCFR